MTRSLYKNTRSMKEICIICVVVFCNCWGDYFKYLWVSVVPLWQKSKVKRIIKITRLGLGLFRRETCCSYGSPRAFKGVDGWKTTNLYVAVVIVTVDELCQKWAHVVLLMTSLVRR